MRSLEMEEGLQGPPSHSTDQEHMEVFRLSHRPVPAKALEPSQEDQRVFYTHAYVHGSTHVHNTLIYAHSFVNNTIY